jgi:hypothetical protein
MRADPIIHNQERTPGSRLSVPGERRRILVISNCQTFPPSFGARQRSDILCRALSAYAEVDLIVVGPMENTHENQMTS